MCVCVCVYVCVCVCVCVEQRHRCVYSMHTHMSFVFVASRDIDRVCILFIHVYICVFSEQRQGKGGQ